MVITNINYLFLVHQQPENKKFEYLTIYKLTNYYVHAKYTFPELHNNTCDADKKSMNA